MVSVTLIMEFANVISYILEVHVQLKNKQNVQVIVMVTENVQMMDHVNVKQDSLEKIVLHVKTINLNLHVTNGKVLDIVFQVIHILDI